MHLPIVTSFMVRMEYLGAWLKGIILHRTSVVHPGGVHPEVAIAAVMSAPGDYYAAVCRVCEWRSTISMELRNGQKEILQKFVDSAGSAEGVSEDEFLVFSIMES